ncbi:carboxymuconolactone decarboxylase family protein [Tropicimonas marinistellae]|uniref:carboxymuconolactone decarboxylase family protein n=1 Tax=Tropicimonas marinistellae TaxID=1739787 RepID=UPI00082F9DE1|nr:carboxymuconolactone decarboxylase family protein [Tropicimonas marinistellae]
MPTDFPLAPLSNDDWPQDVSDLLTGFAGGLNVYRTMAHHPDLLRAWAGLREHIVNRSALGREMLEVVILRTGHRLGSDYEWQQHVQRARKYGLSDARILSVRRAPNTMEPEDALLATAVDELFDKARLSTSTATAIEARFGTTGVIDLMATVGFYSTLGFILNTAGTPLDDDIAAELAENPLEG